MFTSDNTLTNLPDDIFAALAPYLSSGSLYCLLGVSNQLRTIYLPNILSIYNSLNSSEQGEQNEVSPFLLDVIGDMLHIDSVLLFQYFKYTGIIGNGKSCQDGIANEAAKMGSINILKHIYMKGDPKVHDISTFAAEYGQLEILQWVSQYINETNVYDNSEYPGADDPVNYPLLLLFRKIDCGDLNSKTSANAAKCGHLHILKWLRENNRNMHRDICSIAAKCGHLEVLQWARANECAWGEDTCSMASKNGHLEVLQWAIENGCDHSENLCLCAAEGGHLHILKWLREKGHHWDVGTCFSAADHGHLKVLQWARENGCPWDGRTCSFAACRGNLEVLQWAHKNGCPWDVDTYKVALGQRRLNILKYVVEHDCPREGMQRFIMYIPIHINIEWEPETLKFAMDNGCI